MSESERRQAEVGRVEAEGVRVDAEAVREEHEDRRRMREGGPDNNVEGEPAGTTGRVEAEAAREETLRTWLKRYATIIAMTVGFVSLIPTAIFGIFLYATVEKLDGEIADRCEDSAVNRDALRVTILRSFKNLGYAYDEATGKVVPSGTPLAYYATHPEERSDQLAGLIESVERFPAIDCDNT